MTDESKVLPKFAVMLANDDVNSLDRVVALLILIADMDLNKAFITALMVHQQGSCAVGIWHEEVAETVMAKLNEAGLTAIMGKVQGDSDETKV